MNADAPYENQLIGSFLVALGYYGGQRNFDQPIRANLQQQTPLDAAFGDLFVGATRFVAIEFKRFGTDPEMRDELDKWDIPSLLAWHNQYPAAMQTSHRSHLLAFVDPETNGGIVCQSYLLSLICAFTKRPLTAKAVSARDVIEDLYEPKRFGRPPQEVLAYLKNIARFRKQVMKKSGGDRAASLSQNAIMGIARGPDGRIKFMVEDSLTLGLDYRHRLEGDRSIRKHRDFEIDR